MMSYLNYRERALHALHRIATLNAEQQLIYKKALHQDVGLTMADRLRLDQISYELALAQDERNRARCGAPPAPPGYDPFTDPEKVGNRSEGNNSNDAGVRKTNEEEVREMRRLFLCEGWSPVQVWREFPHLKESTVRDILKNRTWHDPNYTPRASQRSCQVREVVRERTRPTLPDS
jgi:hypothetical protein